MWTVWLFTVVSIVLAGSWIILSQRIARHWSLSLFGSDRHGFSSVDSLESTSLAEPKFILPTGSLPSISVIVCARNEEDHISACIKSILQNQYEGTWEVIVVDDHSADNTLRVLRNHKVERLQILSLPAGLEGKKAAVAFALEHSRADYILQTDADCFLPDRWIANWVDHLLTTEADAATGIVSIHKKNSSSSCELFQHYDLLGTMILQNSCMNHLYIPLGNAANMAFGRKAHEEYRTTSQNNEERSGDDIFFLEYVQAHEGSLAFCPDYVLSVQTIAESNWKQLLAQRRRWAEKTGSYHSRRLKLLITWIGLSYLLAAIGLFLGVLNWMFALVSLFLFLTIVISYHIQFRQVDPGHGWYRSLWFTAIHMIFTLWLAACSLLPNRVAWKGRR